MNWICDSTAGIVFVAKKGEPRLKWLHFVVQSAVLKLKLTLANIEIHGSAPRTIYNIKIDINTVGGCPAVLILTGFPGQARNDERPHQSLANCPATRPLREPRISDHCNAAVRTSSVMPCCQP